MGIYGNNPRQNIYNSHTSAYSHLCYNITKEPIMETWRDYQKHVLAELKRCSDLHESTDTKINDLTILVTQLQVRSSLFGAGAGILTVLGYILVESMIKR